MLVRPTSVCVNGNADTLAPHEMMRRHREHEAPRMPPETSQHGAFLVRTGGVVEAQVSEQEAGRA
jgi:hypothetical protein